MSVLVCFLFGETNLIDCEIFLFIANDGNGFGKTSKFISFLYSAYQEREREKRETRAFIFKDRFFVKEIFSLARGVCLLFFR